MAKKKEENKDTEKLKLFDINGKEFELTQITLDDKQPKLYSIEETEDELSRLVTLARKSVHLQYRNMAMYSSYHQEFTSNALQEIDLLEERVREKLSARRV